MSLTPSLSWGAFGILTYYIRVQQCPQRIAEENIGLDYLLFVYWLIRPLPLMRFLNQPLLADTEIILWYEFRVSETCPSVEEG